MRRLEDQHPAWKPDEIEEAYDRLIAQKLVTCPCSEHIHKKSVAVWNVPIIMRKLEDLEKIADQIKDNESSQEEEEVNELGSDVNSDSASDNEHDDDTSSEKNEDKDEDKVEPCPFCGKVHPIQNVFFKSNPSGFLVKFKIVPKENKDEETDEEKEEKKEDVEKEQ